MANTRQIVDAVVHYHCDIGMIEGEVVHPELWVMPWLDDELVAFCAPASEHASKQPLTDSDIVSKQWILREQGSGTRQAFDRAMSGILSELQVRLELQHTEAIKRAVEAGLGLGCLSQVTLQEAFARGSLQPLRLANRQLKRRFYLIYHRNKYLTPGMRRWLQICAEYPGALY